MQLSLLIVIHAHKTKDDMDEPITIKFSVKDKPGALRKALETIGVGIHWLQLLD